jgi:hypothetical protein
VGLGLAGGGGGGRGGIPELADAGGGGIRMGEILRPEYESG